MAESPRLNDILTRCFSSDTRSIVANDLTHREIHDGRMYTVGRSTTVLSASSWIAISILTPSSTVGAVHIKDIFINNSGGIANLQILESPATMVISTAAIIPVNRNRNSTYTAFASYFGNPSLIVSSTATSTQANVLFNVNFGSTGTNANRAGSLFTSSLELILKVNSTYVIKITNNGSDGYADMLLTAYSSTTA